MDISIKKPTTALREAEVRVRKLVGMHVPADPRRGYTDRMEALSGSLLIGFKDKHRPSSANRAMLVAGANRARQIIRKANDTFAGVCFLRKKESRLMQDILAKHFKLIEGDDDNGSLDSNVVNKKFCLKKIFKRDRRSVIEKIRRSMLSISFHLNTGIYLIDIDADHRDIEGGEFVNPANADHGTLGYVSAEKTSLDPMTWRAAGFRWSNGITCGFRHGEIHIPLSRATEFTDISLAQLIIHEATHKYLNTDDEAYATEGAYRNLDLTESLNNADSYAWAAVSLYCKEVKAATVEAAKIDDFQCTKNV